MIGPVVGSYLKAAISTVLCILVTGGLAWWLMKRRGFEPSRRLILLLRFWSAGLLLAAVFGKMGWEIQTINGSTLMERVNNALHWLLYFPGMIILFLSLWFEWIQTKDQSEGTGPDFG